MLSSFLFQLIFLVISSNQDVIITIKSDKGTTEAKKYHFTVETNKPINQKIINTYTTEVPKKKPVYAKSSTYPPAKKKGQQKKQPSVGPKHNPPRYTKRKRPLRVPLKRKFIRHPNIFDRFSRLRYKLG